MTLDIHEVIKLAAAEAAKVALAMHPQPAHVNQKQAAQMLGLSEPTIKKMILNGTIRLNDASMIPIGEINRLTMPKRAA
jgi:hypothetical protein